ncbi:hypothetical protein RIF29_19203 [Crotalaria pallida]|uniref:Uncharacterized protein n=1 Tax=Crotalaria pallida TaxID=3830 RepID=A0AAN9F1C5_CROPI
MINYSIVIDFSKLDEIGLDSLPATQVKKALGVLEEIKGRLEGRVALQEEGGGAHEAGNDAARVVQGAAHDDALGPVLHDVAHGVRMVLRMVRLVQTLRR